MPQTRNDPIFVENVDQDIEGGLLETRRGTKSGLKEDSIYSTGQAHLQLSQTVPGTAIGQASNLKATNFGIEN